jgi:serine/threonine-protein kinase
MLRSDDVIREDRRVPRPGEVVAEKYEVERTIGAGGMGVVVAARHLGLGERVALKFLVPRSGGGTIDEHTLARFFREAQLTARVRSDHVARVLDVGGHESGAPFMVMELLEGTDLQRLVRERGPLPVGEAAGYVLHACLGLAEAHAAGVVHRDLKPANLFLTRRPDGAPLVKVLDFGIGKLVAGVRGAFDHTLTTEADLLGSPLYMSPEQIKAPRDVDARSDVWSMGAILYTLLAGRPPFVGENAGAILAQILSEPPEAISPTRGDVPPALEAVVASCLQKDPGRRMQRADDLARALAPFAAPALGGRPWETADTAVARTANEPAPPPAARRRRHGALAAAGAAVVAFSVAAALSASLQGRAAPAAVPIGSAPAPVSAEPPRPVASASAASAAPSAAAVPPIPSAAASTVGPTAAATASAAPSARPKARGVKRVDVLEDRL